MSKLEKMQGEGGVSLSHQSQQRGGRLAQATRGTFRRVTRGSAGRPRLAVLRCIMIPRDCVFINIREGPPLAERSPLAEGTRDS